MFIAAEMHLKCNLGLPKPSGSISAQKPDFSVMWGCLRSRDDMSHVINP